MSCICVRTFLFLLCFFFVSSWLALRSQLKDPSYSEGTSALASTAPAVSSSLADSSALSEWCVGADDWGVEEGGEGEGGGGGEGSWGEGGEMGKEAKCGDHEEEKMEEEHLKQRAESGGYGRISVGLSEGTKLNELPPSSDTSACPMALATSGPKCEESLGDAGTHTLADEVAALTLSSEQMESGRDLLAYQGPYFGSFYINVINEPSADEMMTAQVEELLQKYGKENVEEWRDPRGEDYERGGKRKPSRGGSGGADGKRGADGGERYEKTVAKHGDRVFQKFHKVMSRCSNQILR